MNLLRHTALFALLLFTYTVNAQVKLVQLTSGLTYPLCIAHTTDSRLFIIEQAGKIRIVGSSGTILATPFLDITDRVKSGGEEGLLGIAFHPQYADNGYFYVNYTGAGDSTRICRFSVSAGDPNVADPNSEVRLITIPQPYLNHKGGNMAFGPDGYLYIGQGDGGYAGDPGNRAQNPQELLGKMLRIDVNSGNPYSIPPSNPFFGNPAYRPEIWALGMRNPWRFSFDRQTGDLWIGDVGQDLYEEIDFQPANDPGGENYGWRCYEADSAYNLAGCLSSSNYTFPIFMYPHDTSNGCCIIGGFVYRGTTYPDFSGKYFYADYCSDKIWTLQNVSGAWQRTFMGLFTGNKISAFGEDQNGELYVTGLISGILYHVTDANTAVPSPAPPTWAHVLYDPESQQITIQTDPSVPSIEAISIYSTDGKIINSIQHPTSNIQHPISTSGLAPGLYLVRINAGEHVGTWKIILH